MKLRIAFLTIIVCFSCCKRETVPAAPKWGSGKAVVVLNEGNFHWGNASVDLFFPQRKEWRKSVFESTNNRPIGDVLQSASIINGNLWLVVNNSGKIEVVDTSNFKSIKTIGGLRSPRYITELAGKVYVTDLFAEKISVINTTSFVLESVLDVSGWTEQIVTHNNLIYFLNKDSGLIQSYNPSNQSIEVVPVKGKPFDLIASENEIYVGSYSRDTAMVTNLGSNNSHIYSYGLQNVPAKINYSNITKSWYVRSGNALEQFNQSQKLVPIFSLKSGSLYASKIIEDVIYLSDAKDYVLNSEIIRIDLDGKLIDKTEAGKITSGFIYLK